MNEFISITFSFFLFVGCFLAALVLARRSDKTESLISWSILFIGILYGLVWANSVLVLDANFSYPGKNYVFHGRGYWVVYGLLSVLLAFSVFLGWKFTWWPQKKMVSLASFAFNFSVKELVVFAWLILVLTFMIRLVYVSAYGGFLGYLDHSHLIRSSVFELKNPWSFLQPFGMLGPFSLLLFFVCIASGEVKGWSTLWSWIGLLLSIPLSLYIFYSLSGRIDFVAFIAVLALFTLMRKKIDGKVLLFSALVSMCFLLFFIFILSNALDLKGAESLSEFVVNELSFPAASFFGQVEQVNQAPRYFVDFVFTPLSLLPSSWMAGIYVSSTEVNTINLMGAAKGSLGVTGGIPVDLLTLGYMQLGPLGIALTGMLFGFLLKTIKFFLDGIAIQELRLILLAFATVRVAMLAVAYAHPEHLVGQLFPVIVIIVLGLCYNAFKKLRFSVW